MNPIDLLRGILAPGVLVGGALLLSWGLASASARRDSAAPPAAAAAAVPLGMLAGLVLLFGWESVPKESWRWLGWLCAALALLGAWESRENSSFGLRWSLRIAMVLAALALVLRKRLLPAGDDPEWAKLALYLGAPLFVIGLWYALLPRLGAVAGAGALWLLSAASSAMLLFAGSLKFALIAGALAGGLGALVIACWLRPSVAGMSGAIVPVAVLLSTLCFVGFEFCYAEYPPWLYLGLALAPLAVALPFLRSHVAKLCALALPVIAVLIVAFRAYDAGEH